MLLPTTFGLLSRRRRRHLQLGVREHHRLQRHLRPDYAMTAGRRHLRHHLRGPAGQPRRRLHLRVDRRAARRHPASCPTSRSWPGRTHLGIHRQRRRAQRRLRVDRRRDLHLGRAARPVTWWYHDQAPPPATPSGSTCRASSQQTDSERQRPSPAQALLRVSTNGGTAGARCRSPTSTSAAQPQPEVRLLAVSRDNPDLSVREGGGGPQPGRRAVSLRRRRSDLDQGARQLQRRPQGLRDPRGRPDRHRRHGDAVPATSRRTRWAASTSRPTPASP